MSCPPGAKGPVPQRKALREVDRRVDVVTTMVLGPEVDAESGDEPRRRAEAPPTVLDAGVSVKLLWRGKSHTCRGVQEGGG